MTHAAYALLHERYVAEVEARTGCTYDPHPTYGPDDVDGYA